MVMAVRWVWINVLMLVVLAYAGTTNRRPVAPVTNITGNSDKGATLNAKMHPAFASAGRQAGLEIWRIENFDPVPVPPNTYGTFYKGDSYIILKTKVDKKGNFSWDIHFWLGSATSQDEAGAAAILSVGLDDKFNGVAVQHREIQGHESSQFLQYFKPAIRYLDGGHASGFSHVVTNAGAEKRLFQIKGKRNIRVRQMEPVISSMNKGDCFILDVGSDIFVYTGENAKRLEKLKAISVANQIRDVDHNGRGKVDIIDEFSSESDTARFFTALGSGSRASVPDESAGGDDQAFEKGEESSVTLYEISDASGQLKVTPLTKPFKQEQLKPQECYILDTVTGSIYVWVGKQATEKEKSEAMSKAQQFLSLKNYPSWVHVTRIPQGTEPTAFKQYFTTWKDVAMSHTRLVRSISEHEVFSEDPATAAFRARVLAKAGTARAFMPAEANGFYKLYRFEGFNMAELYDSEHKPDDFTEFYSAYVYLMRYDYDYGENKGHILYTWRGMDSDYVQLAGAGFAEDKLDEELNHTALRIRIYHDQETRHFLQILKGRLIIYAGKKYQPLGDRLFQIYGNEKDVDMRAIQVPAINSSLNADDVFLLETSEKNYLYFGENATEAEKEASHEFAEKILKGKDYLVVECNEVPEGFWDALGGVKDVKAAEERLLKLRRRIGASPRLYYVTMLPTNQAEFEQVAFNQEDMDIDTVYLLDTGDEIYVWIGGDASDSLKKQSMNIIQHYFASNGLYRHPSNTVIFVVKQEMEPPRFKEYFKHWDDQLWMKRSTVDPEELQALAINDV